MDALNDAPFSRPIYLLAVVLEDDPTPELRAFETEAQALETMAMQLTSLLLDAQRARRKDWRDFATEAYDLLMSKRYEELLSMWLVRPEGLAEQLHFTIAAVNVEPRP